MPFWPILSALNTHTYKFANFMVPVLKPLTIFEFSMKNYFNFAEKIVDQQPDFFMRSLDVDFCLLTIP